MRPHNQGHSKAAAATKAAKMPDPQTMRVHVDPRKCQGHNRCKLAAPDLFVLDEYGNAREAGDGIVPDAMMAVAKLAQASCPEYAVSLRVAK
jgi:ferredoxin